MPSQNCETNCLILENILMRNLYLTTSKYLISNALLYIYCEILILISYTNNVGIDIALLNEKRKRN